jgi:hypothetical protein
MIIHEPLLFEKSVSVGDGGRMESEWHSGLQRRASA